MKIGLIDLDTSHPANWIPLLRGMGHDIVGVFDAGHVHPQGYAQGFARDHQIPRVFDGIEDLADHVDLGIVHGCNWDQHVASARPLVERGKAVLIDKPLAGKLADLDVLVQWADAGARITGGSALWFCAEAMTCRRQITCPTTAVTSCGLGPFDYGVHAYALLMTLMRGEGDPVAVRHLGDGRDGRVMIDWPDGRAGIVITGPESNWLAFQATVMDGRTSAQISVEGGRLYRDFLGSIMPYLAGEVDEPPAPMRELVIAERCALAARVSQQGAGKRIDLERFDDDDGGYDGAAFARRYRSLKYPDVDAGASAGATTSARRAISPASP